VKILQQIWGDIRKGENIDLYLTVGIAIVLAIMNILGIAPSSFLAPLTLAVLALLAVSNLGNRYKLDSLLQRTAAETMFLGDYPTSQKVDILNGKELWVIGINLGRTVETYSPDFETKLINGGKIKILVLDPDGVANKLVSSKFYYPADEKQHRDRILGTLSTLRHLTKVKSDGLEVRTLDYPFAFGVFAINLNSADGVIYLEQYGFKMKRDDIPKLVLHSKDGRWYEHYKEQVFALWNNATPWKYSNEDVVQ
jgi:hypothetical protein